MSQLGTSEGRLPFQPDMKTTISLALPCLHCIQNPCHHTLRYPPNCPMLKSKRRAHWHSVLCRYQVMSFIVQKSGPTDPSRSEKDKLKHRNRDLYHANGNMHHTVQMMQHERDALQQTNQQYAQELSQLKQQMQQLQIQVSQQHPVSRSPPSPITARQPHSGQ